MCFFFFKQKTAYEVRISDWSSDVCSSDLDVSYETIRRWVLKFGPAFARRLRQRRPPASSQWHLDEMVARIAGKRLYLWRAVDHEGEVLDVLAQPRQIGRASCRERVCQYV